MKKRNLKVKSLEKDLEEAILTFHHKMMDELHKRAIKLNFSTSQLEVLLFIFEKGDPTMKDIANRLHITPPSVTIIIETLCERGLVKRETNKQDRRIIKIIITPKTLKLFSKFKSKKLSILKNLFFKLNDENKKELVKILNIITKE